MTATTCMAFPILLAIVFVSPVKSETIDLGEVRMELPTGYEHHKEQGIDTSVGYITVQPGGWRIEYDVGGLAWIPKGLENYDKDSLKSLIFFSRKQVGDVEYRYEVYCPDEKDQACVMWLRLPKQFANFSVRFIGKEHIKTIIDVMKSIKFQSPPHGKTK